MQNTIKQGVILQLQDEYKARRMYMRNEFYQRMCFTSVQFTLVRVNLSSVKSERHTKLQPREHASYSTGLTTPFNSPRQPIQQPVTFRLSSLSPPGGNQASPICIKTDCDQYLTQILRLFAPAIDTATKGGWHLEIDAK